MTRQTCDRPGCDRLADIRVTDDLALCAVDAKLSVPGLR